MSDICEHAAAVQFTNDLHTYTNYSEAVTVVTPPMIDAALSALTPFLEDGNLGYADARAAMEAALNAALSTDKLDQN